MPGRRVFTKYSLFLAEEKAAQIESAERVELKVKSDDLSLLIGEGAPGRLFSYTTNRVSH
jgi:hypothetical protein